MPDAAVSAVSVPMDPGLIPLVFNQIAKSVVAKFNSLSMSPSGLTVPTDGFLSLSASDLNRQNTLGPIAILESSTSMP